MYQPLHRLADAEPAARPAQAPVAEQEPQPDVVLNDGTLTYSAQRLAEVMKFRESNLQKMLDERLAPLGDIQKERQLEVQWHGALDRQRGILTDARQNWPGFKENEKAISEALARDERLSLEAAYRQIVVPRLAPDRDKMRAEILAELNRKPAASSGVTPGAASTGGVTREDSIESIIRDAVRHAA